MKWLRERLFFRANGANKRSVINTFPAHPSPVPQMQHYVIYAVRVFYYSCPRISSQRATQHSITWYIYGFLLPTYLLRTNSAKPFNLLSKHPGLITISHAKALHVEHIFNRVRTSINSIMTAQSWRSPIVFWIIRGRL